MSALHNLLEKLGLKYEDLREDEKKIYLEWSSVLAQTEIKIEDLKKFIPLQLSMLEHQQNDYENSKEKDIFLKAQIRNLKMIHAFILGPEQRRQWLEKHINERIK